SPVQISVWKWVMSVASTWLPTVSTPTKPKALYFLTASPATSISSKVASDQSVLQVSTATSVYAPLKREITSKGFTVGAGAAVAGTPGSVGSSITPPPSDITISSK